MMGFRKGESSDFLGDFFSFGCIVFFFCGVWSVLSFYIFILFDLFLAVISLTLFEVSARGVCRCGISLCFALLYITDCHLIVLSICFLFTFLLFSVEVCAYSETRLDSS